MNSKSIFTHVGQYYFVNQLSAFLTSNTHFLDILPETLSLFVFSFLSAYPISHFSSHPQRFHWKNCSISLCSEITWKHLLGRLSLLSCILWADMHSFRCLFESQCVAGFSVLSITPFLLLVKGVGTVSW